MKKFILSVIFGFVVLPAAIGGLFYSLNKNGFFNLDEIHVAIGSEISASPENQDEEKEYLKSFENYFAPLKADVSQEILQHKSVSLWDLDLDQMAKQIAQREWVEKVYISRRWPSQLEVKVIPKEIKLLLVEKGGKFIPVVDGGQFLSPVNAKQAPDVALLSGEVFSKNPELRKKAVEVITQVPVKGKFSRKTISEVHYDNKEGFWMTLIESGIKVKVGENAIPLKAARVSQVLEYMDGRQLEARVIDANLSKKVLVRLRKDP